MTTVFQKYDQDGDGHLSMSQLKMFCEEMKIRLTNMEKNMIMADGSASYGEMDELIQRMVRAGRYSVPATKVEPSLGTGDPTTTSMSNLLRPVLNRLQSQEQISNTDDVLQGMAE